MKKKHFDMVFLPEGAVVVTKAEREAMNIYSDKVRRETITNIFDEVEELLQMAIRTESIKIKHSNSRTNKYAKHILKALVEDMRTIESRYKE